MDIIKSSLLSVTLAVLGVSIFTNSTQAATVNGTIGVSITLINSCLVNGGTPTGGMTFGTLGFGSQPTEFTSATASVQGTGSNPIQLQCSSSTTPTLTMVSGVNDTHATGSYLHAMTTGGKYVSYNVYTDVGLTNVIQNGAVFFTSANNGTVENVNIYGQAVGATGLTPGTYTDTLTVTLTF